MGDELWIFVSVLASRDSGSTGEIHLLIWGVGGGFGEVEFLMSTGGGGACST